MAGNEDDLIEHISKKYQIIKGPDGTFTVFDGKSHFTITEINRNSDSKIINTAVGRNDKEPDFFNRKGPIQGMFPDFENSKKPILKIDPTVPSSKKKKQFPDPDNDDFNPGPSMDQF